MLQNRGCQMFVRDKTRTCDAGCRLRVSFPLRPHYFLVVSLSGCCAAIKTWYENTLWCLFAFCPRPRAVRRGSQKGRIFGICGSRQPLLPGRAKLATTCATLQSTPGNSVSRSWHAGSRLRSSWFTAVITVAGVCPGNSCLSVSRLRGPWLTAACAVCRL